MYISIIKIAISWDWLTLICNFIFNFESYFMMKLIFTLESKLNIIVQFVHQSKYKDHLWLTQMLSIRDRSTTYSSYDIQIWTKMYISIIKIAINLGIDWP